MPCSVVSFTLRSEAEWEGEKSKQQLQSARGREGGMSYTGLQPVCVREADTTATLQSIEL